jgi:glucose-6-phosphate 1-epimerase
MKYTYSTPLSSSITQSGALPRLTVKHPACSAELFLHGAHLTRWQPAGQEPVLFVSSDAVYAPGMPIRGGVPICFPWFGPHATDKSLPAHGFARTRAWELAGFGETADHAWFHLQFSSSAQTRDLWGYDFQADFRLTLGRELDLKLSVSNTGATPLTFEEALHTYYHVSDIRAVGVSGLNRRSEAQNRAARGDSF